MKNQLLRLATIAICWQSFNVLADEQLTKLIEENRYQIRMLQERVEMLEQRMELEQKSPKQNISPLAQDRAEYDEALMALKEHRYDQAQEKFWDFIQNHPTSTMQSDAYFWYGESLYRMRDYKKAALIYLQGYKNYPNSTKAIDSLFKATYALKQSGQIDKSCNILRHLKDLVVDSSPKDYQKALELQQKLNCHEHGGM